MADANQPPLKDAVWMEVEGVRIPFASPQTLWRTKQTRREKDIPDILFLRELLERKGIDLEPAKTTSSDLRIPRWLKRLLGKKTN